jgi:DNA repair protein RadA/Sms
MELAKKNRIPVLMIGHVNKEGFLAGPKVLEHMVDAVLQLEGDPDRGYRLLRAQKNRFGATHEIGIFEMTEGGMQELRDPSRIFLENRSRRVSGSAITVAMEGTRPLLLEVQALATPSYFGVPQRRVAGLEYNRSCLMLAVMEKRVGIMLGNQDVFISLAGGFAVSEPAMDLAIAGAVMSSVRESAIDPDWVLLGEVGLGGEVRGVPHLNQRLREAAQMGFKRAVVPSQIPGIQQKSDSDIELFGVEALQELKSLFFH